MFEIRREISVRGVSRCDDGGSFRLVDMFGVFGI